MALFPVLCSTSLEPYTIINSLHLHPTTSGRAHQGRRALCTPDWDAGSIRGLGRSPGGWNGHPIQYSCLENPMDRGAWQVTVYGVSKSQTGLSDWARTHAHTHTRSQTVFVFLSLPCLTKHNVLQVHPCSCKLQHFILFYGWVVFHCVYVPHLHPFICWWTYGSFPHIGYCK